MVNFKVGEMTTLYANVEFKDFLGNKILAKKGTKIWIGADNLAHYQDGTIQSLPENVTVKGYDDRGITERIFTQLKTDFPLLEEFCMKYKDKDGIRIISSEDIKESIQYALHELGIC